MKMKKFGLVLMLLVVFVFIAACGGNDANDGDYGDTNENGSTEVAEDRTFQLLTENHDTERDTQVIRELFDEYRGDHEAQLELEVSILGQTDIIQRIQLLTSSNDLPELFKYESGVPLHDLIDQDYVQNVEEAFTDIGIYDQLNTGVVELLNRLSGERGLYAIPVELNIEGFWFNQEIFDEHGLEIPTTWDELMEISDVLLENGVQPFAVAGQERWPITRFINGYVIRTYGVDAMDRVANGELDITDDGFVEAAEVVQEMSDRGYFGQGVNTIDYDTASDIFLQGNAAMYYMGSWALGQFNNEDVNLIGTDNIGFFNIPLVEGGVGTLDEYSMNSGMTISIAKDKYDEQVADWLEYTFANFGDRALANHGMITGFNVEKMPADVEPLTQMVLEIIEEIEDGALWFEANMDTRTKDAAEQNAQLLINGDMSAQDYMEALQ
ncbi:ABC transporter substrate-binding protein [Alkalihalobacillus hemicellulosilyticus]|nr:extracellular solute-binding protein [Halalkalibacter hemicellulosilyticus]